MLRTIYQMSEAQFRQYWIAKVFRAEAPSAPRIVYSNEMAADMAASVPGAVAFVDASQIPKGLKVLKINGSCRDKRAIRCTNRLLKKPSRLKSALRGDTYVVDSPCSVGAHACGSRM